MDKIPIEIFISQQLKNDRFRSIISQMAVNEALVELTLIRFFKDQGVNFVTPSLAASLADHVARELEQRNGVSGVVSRMLKL